MAAFSGVVAKVPITHVTITMQVADDGSTATLGMISGILPSQPFIDGLRSAAESSAVSLCNGSDWYGIGAQLEAASDILQDGTQDPTKTCDGISIGLGFDAVRVNLGDVVVVPPGSDPCCSYDADGGAKDGGVGCDGGGQ